MLLAVIPFSVRSFLGYVNPIRWPAKLTQLFFDTVMPETEEVECVEIDGDGIFPGGIREYFDLTSKQYPTVEFELSSGHKINIAKTWVSDIKRSGEPDEFWINGKAVEPPRTDEEVQAILGELYELADGNEELVAQWTQLWSYRPKITLMNELTDEFKSNYKLSPVFPRNGFSKVVISLDVLKRDEFVVSCKVVGEITDATDEKLDVHSVSCNHESSFVYCSKYQVLKNVVALD